MDCELDCELDCKLELADKQSVISLRKKYLIERKLRVVGMLWSLE